MFKLCILKHLLPKLQFLLYNYYLKNAINPYIKNNVTVILNELILYNM